MDFSYLSTTTDALMERGVVLQPGLSDQELEAIERVAGFRFPPDLRQFLAFALPIEGPAGHFPEWRVDPVEVLDRTRGYLADGVAFDVEHAGVWPTTWGPRPSGTTEAVARARERVTAAPPLIPMFSHRFIPAEPVLVGNPVFSIVQTDVIYYGFDLADYLHAEFGVPRPSWSATSPRSIRFWIDFL